MINHRHRAKTNVFTTSSASSIALLLEDENALKNVDFMSLEISHVFMA